MILLLYFLYNFQEQEFEKDKSITTTPENKNTEKNTEKNTNGPKGTTKTTDIQSNDETTKVYQKDIAKKGSSPKVMPPGQMILLLLILVEQIVS